MLIFYLYFLEATVRKCACLNERKALRSILNVLSAPQCLYILYVYPRSNRSKLHLLAGQVCVIRFILFKGSSREICREGRNGHYNINIDRGQTREIIIGEYVRK